MNCRSVARRSGMSPARLWQLLAATVLVASQPGCATVTRGHTDEVWFESEPPGARVRLEPSTIDCITPCRQELRRKREYLVHFEKEGYVAAQVRLSPKFAGAGAAGFAGNVILGGLVGMGVDAATGASKVLRPNPVQVTLLPATAPPVPLPVREAGTETVAMQVATPVMAPMAAALQAPAAPAAAGENCIQPALVDREICLGRLRLGMTKSEAIALLGAPDGTSRDQMTFRYGDRYLKFDAAELLTGISAKP